MKYEVAQDKHSPNEWRVEAIDFDGDGDCFVTLFGGPQAELRAREYAAWKQAQKSPAV
jgi:hypothetical protein